MKEEEPNKEIINYQNVAIVILAAGKGTRLKTKPEGVNKTAMKIGDKYIIELAFEKFELLKLGQAIVIVNYARKSVEDALSGKNAEFVEQTKPLGTGHAVECALSSIKDDCEYVVVVNGDDSFRYTPEIYEKLIEAAKGDCAMAFLTGRINDPSALGRVVRDENGEILRVVEEKDATESERKINEINMGAYCFKRDFLKEFVDQIEFSSVKHEKYITSLIGLAISNGQRVVGVEVDIDKYCSVNTDEDFERAQNLTD